MSWRGDRRAEYVSQGPSYVRYMDSSTGMHSAISVGTGYALHASESSAIMVDNHDHDEWERAMPTWLMGFDIAAYIHRR